jgi:four helix bundle protein
MGFEYEKLDVYRTSIAYVGWGNRFCETLKDHRNAKDPLLRASQAIPLNIAEGNGKATDRDRRRYFEIARGSALECGAIQDALQFCVWRFRPEGNATRKALPDRIVAMLTKLGATRLYRACRTNHSTSSESIPIPIPTPTPMVTRSRRIANNRLQVAVKPRLSQTMKRCPNPSGGQCPPYCNPSRCRAISAKVFSRGARSMTVS